MPITNEHFKIIKRHFHFILGNKCCVCNSTENLHIHHKNGTHLLNGEYKQGRGSSSRMYDWFTEFEKNNLLLVCRDCHFEIDKKHGTR